MARELTVALLVIIAFCCGFIVREAFARIERNEQRAYLRAAQLPGSDWITISKATARKIFGEDGV